MHAALVEVVRHARAAGCVILNQLHICIRIFRAVEIVGSLRADRVAAVDVVTGSAVVPRRSTVGVQILIPAADESSASCQAPDP